MQVPLNVRLSVNDPVVDCELDHVPPVSVKVAVPVTVEVVPPTVSPPAQLMLFELTVVVNVLAPSVVSPLTCHTSPSV